ncbi:LLM class flavin-dependent oxidoreductase [Actinotalea solisilvae]|uniref:LLM class flavin-dependent oxidoreductase n=1 Tax=Actinotalea solisilvae TaxID=2072922 RepID=UPI0018F160D6|nr:LLM class flavin-dependent oxidoreductase [Actinotalea solisilvae]
MTDYGQELRLGAFLTPSAADPRRVVALAQASERAGLDLVALQDHPYQPAFLDTWTLLSHLGALTSRVRLAPDVANLPLRPPAVLARSVASLDLLTGGRVELGLGAGAFWDAVVAMGGRRLTPGEAVRATEEAIAVVRGVWDVADRRPLRVEGEVHRVVGAKRGPAPAHDVEIWLGAYGPRMLALTGRLGDGWVPSLGRTPLADLVAGHAVVDDAAHAAGRDPAAVRRLLNVGGRFEARSGGLLVGPPAQWVEQLAALALEHGFSTFVLMGDDERAIELLGQEVAPALRALVAAERGPAAGTRPGPRPVRDPGTASG